jgi:hypothetical protein
VPASDNESIRGWTRFGEGSTRSEKVQGEFASSALKRRRSRGAPERDRPKLTTANSFVESSSFLATRRAGIASEGT